MRTARLLPVSPSMYCSDKVYLPGGCTCRGGCTCLGGVPAWGAGVYLPGGCTCPGGYLTGGCTWPRGVYLPGSTCPGGCTHQGGPAQGGVPARGCTCLGVYLAEGVYLPRYSPPVNRMTDRCKNITLPQTSFAGVLPTYCPYLPACTVQGVSACPGVSAQGCVADPPPCEQNDRQV